MGAIFEGVIPVRFFTGEVRDISFEGELESKEGEEISVEVLSAAQELVPNVVKAAAATRTPLSLESYFQQGGAIILRGGVHLLKETVKIG